MDEVTDDDYDDDDGDDDKDLVPSASSALEGDVSASEEVGQTFRQS